MYQFAISHAHRLACIRAKSIYRCLVLKRKINSKFQNVRSFSTSFRVICFADATRRVFNLFFLLFRIEICCEISPQMIIASNGIAKSGYRINFHRKIKCARYSSCGRHICHRTADGSRFSDSRRKAVQLGLTHPFSTSLSLRRPHEIRKSEYAWRRRQLSKFAFAVSSLEIINHLGIVWTAHSG